MQDDLPIRLILQIPREPGFVEAYEGIDDGRLRDRIDERLGTRGIPWRPGERPSLAFRAWLGREPDATKAPPDALLLGLLFRSVEDARAYAAQVTPESGFRVATDARIRSFGCWCPGLWRPPFFDTRHRASRLIHATALAEAGLDGDGVNILVIDEGISEARLGKLFGGLRWGGGVEVDQPGEAPRLPGQARPDGHGTMIARNLLSLAPKARIFDLPLLPDRIRHVGDYILWAWAAFLFALARIAVWAATGRVSGPWVLCNAWGIYDRRTESLALNYTGNPDHPFNQLVTGIDALGIDQVFAAGNCGGICPNGLCGPGDRGPRQSILGANSHPRVLTVGAVRADGLRLGYSAQGPGQEGFLPLANGAREVRKPDLSAPSHFVEPGDGSALSTGTSAACGIAAGAVAALRGGFPALAPEALREALRASAWQPRGPAGWNRDLGHGVLDLKAALGEMGPPSA